MPKNQVSDPISEEIAFGHLVLAGTMTDRRAAEAVGLNPDSTLDSSDPILVHPLKPSGATPSAPHARVPDSAADKRVASSIEKNPFTWRLRL